MVNKNYKFIKIEVEEVEKFKGQLFLKEEIEYFLYNYNFIPVFRDFEYDYQFNVLFIKKEYYSKVSNQIELTINESVANSINLYKILRLISDKKNFISEMKKLTISLFGKKFGNYIVTLLGSKSSTAYLSRDNKNKKEI